jgi:hypothetical protein
MKELLSNIAVKLVENNFSDEVLMICGSILKEVFVKEGYSLQVANEFSIDALKITINTLKSLK